MSIHNIGLGLCKILDMFHLEVKLHPLIRALTRITLCFYKNKDLVTPS